MKTFSRWDEPISADAPEGVNIEYDSRFLELQSAAEGKPEQQYGDTIIPAEEPDWATVEKLCNQLLAESKDLRVLAYYTQALTAKHGLVGFCASCEAIKTNVDSYWDSIYPKLEDEDGEYDPFYRINALSAFTTLDGIVKEIFPAKLLVNGLTQQPVTVKEAVSVLQGNDPQSYPGGKDRLMLDIRVSADTGKPELVALIQALGHLKEIQNTFSTKLQDEHSLNFEVIQKPLTLIHKAVNYNDGSTPQPQQAEQTDHTAETSAANGTQEQTAFQDADAWRRLNIKNRADVDLALEKICVYFETLEPSHPAPLFIRRVQRLMNMDFYDIMKDISPESIANLEVLIGKPEEEAGTSGE
ncbi:type VI secretion system protein TssA [Neisseria wadsworthii]|uniref:ImpA-related N-terminal family protein n=1 Tax=Neisseria wadsworthii 9715 TaxID=1030841 RepID=G4CMZ6_9NEIS|nr:type VI secretion system protein TssA [Neisseria wadsworthii]EGZ50924.1 ImpA-related N-terminal family protein [Neisseria wadsworthii 9715]QMT36456.1 type VI secretion system protein TssA [Neisseria wadsworthii]